MENRVTRVHLYRPLWFTLSHAHQARTSHSGSRTKALLPARTNTWLDDMRFPNSQSRMGDGLWLKGHCTVRIKSRNTLLTTNITHISSVLCWIYANANSYVVVESIASSKIALISNNAPLLRTVLYTIHRCYTVPSLRQRSAFITKLPACGSARFAPERGVTSVHGGDGSAEFTYVRRFVHPL